MLATMLAAGVVLVTEAAAQGPPDPARARELRRELEQRFVTQLREQLQLTAEQEGRVRTILVKYADRRRDLDQGDQELRQALSRQLRPGIAAKEDSVTMLVDKLTASRVSYAQLMRDEMQELSAVLSPIQRGQLFLMRDRLLLRAQELRQGRPGGMGPPPLDF